MKARVKSDYRFSACFVGGTGFNRSWRDVPERIEDEVLACASLETEIEAEQEPEIADAPNDDAWVVLAGASEDDGDDGVDNVPVVEEMAAEDELALRQRARALGIKSWQSKGIKRLKEEIEKAEGG